MARHQALVELLVGYYQTNGDWQGVDGLLDQIRIGPGPMPRMWQDRRPGAPRRDTAPQIVLAGAHRRVVYDSHDPRLGRRLTRDEQAAAQEISVGSEAVGLLVLALPVRRETLGPMEHPFVSRL